jgi:hypothetical protein
MIKYPDSVWSISLTYFIGLFTTRRCIAPHMIQVSMSKIKITLGAYLKTLVRRKTSTLIRRFKHNLAKMCTIVRCSVERKIQVAEMKFTHRGQSSDRNMKMYKGTIYSSFIEGL